jgi:hypothetical protein
VGDFAFNGRFPRSYDVKFNLRLRSETRWKI